ncbi:Protein of unknown function DUF4779 [Trinorchestia longiramus]|nr:Protein of unknown function DUF4779 [Trinorchestia longiramus]
MTMAASTTADTTTRTIIMDTIMLPRRDTKATIRDPKAISKRDIRIRQGFKNVYHKEEFGQNKKFYDDSDHKSHYGHHDGFDSFFKGHKGGGFGGGSFKVGVQN